MANAIPTLMVVNYKGSGNVAVHKLLNGTTLDPTQDGNDVLTGTLEAPTNQYNAQNRLLEAFGLRLLLHGARVYERDTGGTGNWGAVESVGSATTASHSGLHLLFPGGVPTVAFMDYSGGNIRLYTTIDGTTWVGPTNIGVAPGTIAYVSNSLVFGNSLVWAVLYSTGTGVTIYDLSLASTLQINPTGNLSAIPRVDMVVNQSKLFFAYQGTSGGPLAYPFRVDRLDGSAFTNIFLGANAYPNSGMVPVIFNDGYDLIIIYATGAKEARRLTNPTGSSTATNITTTLLSSVPGSIPLGWNKYVSIDPDPTQATVYLWCNAGDTNTGTYDLYRYRYRQITHGAPAGAFTLGEFVEQASTGARGRIMETTGTSLDLTDVTGTFNATNNITGDDSGAVAAATSLLNEQALVSIGNGIPKTNFGISHIADGGLDRIPAKGAARPAWDGLPSEVPNARRHFFRVYGTGSTINLKLYYSTAEEAPDMEGTLSGVAISSGSPPTTPTFNISLNRIENLTPDDGATLYYVDHNATADGITAGQKHTLILDID
jgi:hypothetical protein